MPLYVLQAVHNWCSWELINKYQKMEVGGSMCFILSLFHIPFLTVWGPDMNTIFRWKDRNGGKLVLMCCFYTFSVQAAMKVMSKNNPHHCFSALILMFVWKCFFFFLQAHSFHPLVASLAPWMSLVGSREKTEGEETCCRRPTAADWRMYRRACLMLYKMNTKPFCWAAHRSQKDNWRN